MLNPHYYAEYDGNIIYSYVSQDSKPVFNLFVNEKHVDSIPGILGDFELSHNEYTLKVSSKLSKTEFKFSVWGKEIPSERVNRKKMREILTSKNIFNGVNPTPSALEEARFKITDLIIPIALILLAIGIEYYTYDKKVVYKIIPGIPCLIAGFMLYGVLITQFKFLASMRKLAIGVAFGVFILVQFIAEFLYS